MKKAVDLTGQRFGRLVVIRQNGTTTSPKCKRPMWECQCDCGNVVTVAGYSLRRGATKSCGCLMREMRSGGRKPMRLVTVNGETRNINAWAKIIGVKHTTIISAERHGKTAEEYIAKKLKELEGDHGRN